MTNPLYASVLVGVGGCAGSVARYGLSLAAQRLALEWPAGTLTANVLGCLLIGLITELAAGTETLSPEARLALATGFCGGFTTLSSLVYEAAGMLRSSEYLHAALYVGASLALSMAAFVGGVTIVRVALRLGGGAWS